MALRPRHNPDIPGTSKPSGCSFLVDEENKKKCGKPTAGYFEGMVVVYEKEIKIKKPLCLKHLDELKARKDAM